MLLVMIKDLCFVVMCFRVWIEISIKKIIELGITHAKHNCSWDIWCCRIAKIKWIARIMWEINWRNNISHANLSELRAKDFLFFIYI